jgi:phosphatidate cytidylyltransferase
MLKRVITSIVALIVFVPILVFSDTWIFPAAMALAAFIGCYEMLSCVGKKKNLFLTLPILLCAVFFPLYVRYSFVIKNSFSEFSKLALGIVLVVILYVFAVAVFDNKRTSVTDAALILIACFYIIASFSAIVYLHDYIVLGKYIYLLTFICAWMTDIFAYFTGMLLGKHKLIPSVSPKKTVEGGIGGVVFCVISIVVFGMVIENFFAPGEMKANYFVLAVSGVFISVVSQIGDLIMSLIKRHYGIKDYGKILPGHGGILDRFDSVMAVSIILAFICTYFNFFG